MLGAGAVPHINPKVALHLRKSVSFFTSVMFCIHRAAAGPDARWAKKHGKSFCGYKNHVYADARHKLIRDYDATDASVHDSQKLDGLLNNANISRDVYADSAYRSAETEVKLDKRGFRSRIHNRIP